MPIFQIDITDKVMQSITGEISKLVAEEFDKKMADLNQRKNEIVSGIVLSATKEIEIDRMRDNIVITLKEINIKKTYDKNLHHARTAREQQDHEGKGNR